VWADSTNADFASTAANQFLIRASNGVGIGTNSPEGLLHVFKGSVGNVTAHSSTSATFEDDSENYISILSPSGTAKGILLGDQVNPAASGMFYDLAGMQDLRFMTASGVRLTLSSTGNLTATGCVIGSNIACPSDGRFKRDIKTLPDALGKVERLRGVSYEWNSSDFADRDFPAGQQVGLIAQEVREVVPQAVVEQSDGYLAVDYSRLVPLLIEGMKEQQRQLDQQRTMIDELRAELIRSRP